MTAELCARYRRRHVYAWYRRARSLVASPEHCRRCALAPLLSLPSVILLSLLHGWESQNLPESSILRRNGTYRGIEITISDADILAGHCISNDAVIWIDDASRSRIDQIALRVGDQTSGRINARGAACGIGRSGIRLGRGISGCTRLRTLG